MLECRVFIGFLALPRTTARFVANRTPGARTPGAAHCAAGAFVRRVGDPRASIRRPAGPNHLAAPRQVGHPSLARGAVLMLGSLFATRRDVVNAESRCTRVMMCHDARCSNTAKAPAFDKFGATDVSPTMDGRAKKASTRRTTAHSSPIRRGGIDACSALPDPLRTSPSPHALLAHSTCPHCVCCIAPHGTVQRPRQSASGLRDDLRARPTRHVQRRL